MANKTDQLLQATITIRYHPPTGQGVGMAGHLQQLERELLQRLEGLNAEVVLDIEVITTVEV